MSDRDHARLADSLAAYALGALPSAEAAELERHLGECGRCREDLAEMERATGLLAASVTPRQPPPRLRDRLMAIVEAEAELLAATGAEADRPAPRAPRRRRLFPRPAITAAAAAAALAAGVVGGVVLIDEEPPPPRVVAARITDRAVAPAARAHLRVSATTASLVVHGLPDPPARRVYQVWLKAPGRAPAAAGVTFAVRTGEIELPRALRAGEAVLVTHEPVGGSPSPTRDPLIVSRPV